LRPQQAKKYIQLGFQKVSVIFNLEGWGDLPIVVWITQEKSSFSTPTFSISVGCSPHAVSKKVVVPKNVQHSDFNRFFIPLLRSNSGLTFIDVGDAILRWARALQNTYNRVLRMTR
jgi:hypothetical protein